MTKLIVTDSPWTLVALGALAGVWVGSHGKREPAEPRGVVMSILAAFALRLVREAAMVEMAKLAKTLFARPAPPPATPYAS